jgi:hypothetical protein
MSTTNTIIHYIWTQCDGFPSLDAFCEMLLHYTIEELIEYDDLENFVIEEAIADDDINESDMRIFAMADDYERSFHPRSRSPRTRRHHTTIESEDRLVAVGRVVDGHLVVATH